MVCKPKFTLEIRFEVVAREAQARLELEFGLAAGANVLVLELAFVAEVIPTRTVEHPRYAGYW